MFFYIPTKVFSEKDCVFAHRRELASLGTHALIVTGRSSSRKNGSLSDTEKALGECSVGFTVFDGVEENPSVETVMKARDIGISSGADFVIGIGGGSPLDAAKAIAVMMKEPLAQRELLFDSSASPAHLPVAAIPTTCGTGSEVTGISVLTRHDLRTKMSMTHKVFPDLALCDGKYILTAPQRLIAATAVDALSHLIESYINSTATDYSRMIADAGLGKWRECRGYLNGSIPLDYEGAVSLMTASTIGGMAIAHTGTTIPHGLSYTLTYEGGVPHGAAVGAFQKGYVQNACKGDREHILSLTGFADTDELGSFIAEISPVNVSAELLEKAADAVMKNTRKLASCPYEVNREVMSSIIGGVVCSG